MEIKFIVFTLLIAGTNGSTNNGRMADVCKCLAKTPDPCDECRSKPIIITDTKAEKCSPDGVFNGICNCACKVVRCIDGDIIDTSTCTSNGRLDDCRCIPNPVDPCAECRNAPIFITGTSATQDVPMEDERCICIKKHVLCEANHFIDPSTCTSNGHISACRCVPEGRF